MPSRDREVNRFIRQYNEKKQAKTRRRTVMRPFKLVFGIIFVVVVAYFAVQIFLAFNSPMTTATALMTTVNDEFSVVGYLAREETLLTADYSGILLYTAREGQKIARNTSYAATYSNQTAAALKMTITSLEDRINILEVAFSANTDTTSSDQRSYRSTIRAAGPNSVPVVPR